MYSVYSRYGTVIGCCEHCSDCMSLNAETVEHCSDCMSLNAETVEHCSDCMSLNAETLFSTDQLSTFR